ncbi:hypothetical protein D3C84_821740 [compost metagenome]
MKGEKVSVGELMDSCTTFHDQVSNGNPTPPPPEERPPMILDWIKANPNYDVNDLSEIIDNWYISGHGKDRPRPKLL